MKKPLRLAAALLSFCVLAAAFPTAGLAAGGGTVHTISEGTDLYDLLPTDGVKDGDTLQCTGTVYASKTPKIDDPWIINKSVTIEGGILNVGTGGIVLGADVTFRNTELLFTKPICNAIVANGYALTLDGVTTSSRGYSFNVFCGTLVPNSNQTFKVPLAGNSNEVIIRGNTNLRSGNTAVVGESNIYAGNLSLGSMNPNFDEAGAASDFTGNPTIRIEGCANALNPLGTIYASGAQQRNLFEVDAQKPTTRNLDLYTVSGTVTIEGGNKLPDVNGATNNDGRGTTNVVYQGNDIQATKTFQDISSLSVESGNLKLNQDSYFRNGGALSLSSGAKLDLKAFKGTTLDGVGSYHSDNGFVFLDQEQTWKIDGRVSGTTKVVIDGLSYDGKYSTKLPKVGRTYIQTPTSSEGNFQLLPYSNQPDMTLENDGSGNWVATQPTQGASKLVSLAPEDTTVFSGTMEAIIPLKPTCTVGAELPWESLPLNIYVNGQEATFDIDSGCYMVGDLGIYVGDFSTGDGVVLSVGYKDLSYATAIPDGTYTIQITVPGEHTSTGNPITASCTLTVGDSGPTVKTIPIPTANTNLKWTGLEQTGVNEGTGYTLTGHKGTDVGEYTATAKLQDGYQWADGSEAPQTIKWSIAKADGPAAPTGLSAVAPTTENGADGKITGTTAAMEYATDSGFSGAQTCGAGETTGLPAGTYYVRVAGTKTHEPGASASITVPAYGAPTVTGISVSSTGHKTEYKVGDALDVTGLTISVAYSDKSTKTVSVTENMVSGFNSSQAAQDQTLTITYEGKTAAYTVNITASQQPGGTEHRVTIDNIGDGGSGAGTYAAGATVTVRAGSRAGYVFSHWQSQDVALTAPNTPELSFVMPDQDVVLVAVWYPSQPSGGGGGGSSGGGSSSGGGGGSSDSGSSDSDSSDDSPSYTGGGSTTKNPDGSTTTTGTNRYTGAVTQTTRHPDGGRTVVETKKDGTVTTTQTAKDGSTVKTVEQPGGGVETTVKRSDGLTASVRTDGDSARAEVSLPSGAVRESQLGGAVALPIPALPGKDAELTVHTGAAWPVRVAIPAQGSAATTVACLVNRDGSESLISTAVLTGGQMTVSVPDGATVRLRDNAKSFDDTGSHWAQESIRFVAARELFSGSSGTTFSPDTPMTRAMLMTVLARLDGVDTAQGAVYERGVSWAVARGISDGQNQGEPVTREQLVTMLYRYAGSPAAADRDLPFSDAAQVSGYAREAACWAMENGIISGYDNGALIPGGRATRAQVAAMLTQYVKYMNQK